MVKRNACVFISGRGSNLGALINNSRNANFPIKISLVITDNTNAKGLLFAKKNSIPFLIVNTKKRNFENIILNIIKKYKISLICLAGYMNKEKKTGCTIHFVNEKLDSGKIIVQKSFFIQKNDNEKILKTRTQKLEHLAFAEAVRKIYRYN